MAIIAPIAPPTVAPLPTPPSTSDPVNFDPRADNFLGALPANQGQMNALGTNVYDNALKTYNSATDANNAASAAVPAATTATQAASVASASLASMQKLYLGAKTTAPFVDNQGNPLELGAWYTNTVTGFWYWWSGSSWKIGVSDLSVVDWDTQVVGKPITLAGYGITDAVNIGGGQTVTGVKNFSNGLDIGTSTSLRYSSNLLNINLPASNSLRVVINGAVVATTSSAGFVTTGDLSALSDERLKLDWKPVNDDFIIKFSKVKYGTYSRKDTGQRQAGVSAQELRNVLPEVVHEDEKGILSVSYGKAAIVACLELSKEVLKLRQEIEKIKGFSNGAT